MKKYITLAAMALTFAACTQVEDLTPQTDGDAVKIIATIDKLQARVAYDVNGGTNFISGDQIFVENTKRTSKNLATYTFNGTTWTTTDALVWNCGAATSQFLAWYPAGASYDEFSLPADQSDDSKLAAADWMTASTAVMEKPADNTLNLDFQHLLTKVTVTVNSWGSQYDNTEKTLTDAKIHSNSKNVEITYGAGEGGKNAYHFSGSDIAVTPSVSSTGYTAIVVPVSYADDDVFMTFTVNGTDNHKVFANSTLTKGLEPGKHYTFSLTVGKDAVGIDKVNVTPWTDKEIVGGVAEELPYLTFTAEETQTMTIETVGNYTLDESLEYHVKGRNWTQLTAGTPVTFGGEKGALRLRGKSAIGTAINNREYAIISFGNSNVQVACSGDIRTLVDYENYAIATTDNARFCNLFKDCTSLTTAPELPATTLANSCYNSMFYGCTSLAAAPELPAETLATSCYSYMFYGCTSLTAAPELPATTLADYCYDSMFDGCTSLTTAPELPATTLADYCYLGMFRGCTSLAAAPELPATTLEPFCYGSMFDSCSSLATAPELPAETLATSCYSYMFYGCTSLSTAPELPVTTLADYCYLGMFRGCTSLTAAPELPATTLANSCYRSMFNGCTSLTAAPELSATILADFCYSNMFEFCTSLTTAPELPATELKEYCYHLMFCGCTSLTIAPELPATNLAYKCYAGMFYDCTNLIEVPELPATTLADYCYYYMFCNCTNLSETPELPATKLVEGSYMYMFMGCTNLNKITMLATDISASSCLDNWVDGVSSNGTFTKAAAMLSLPSGTSGIPEGWFVVLKNDLRNN